MPGCWRKRDWIVNGSPDVAVAGVAVAGVGRSGWVLALLDGEAFGVGQVVAELCVLLLEGGDPVDFGRRRKARCRSAVDIAIAAGYWSLVTWARDGAPGTVGPVSRFWRPAKETERPVFPVAGGSATSTGGFGVGAASLGSLERGGDGECRVDLGDGRPDDGGLLPVAMSQVFGRLLGEFLGLTVVS